MIKRTAYALLVAAMLVVAIPAHANAHDARGWTVASIFERIEMLVDNVWTTTARWIGLDRSHAQAVVPGVERVDVHQRIGPEISEGGVSIAPEQSSAPTPLPGGGSTVHGG